MTYEPKLHDEVRYKDKYHAVLFINKSSKCVTLRETVSGTYSFNVPYAELLLVNREFVKVGDYVTLIGGEGVWRVVEDEYPIITVKGPMSDPAPLQKELKAHINDVMFWSARISNGYDAQYARGSFVKQKGHHVVYRVVGNIGTNYHLETKGGTIVELNVLCLEAANPDEWWVEAPKVISGIPQPTNKGSCCSVPMVAVYGPDGVAKAFPESEAYRFPSMSAIAESRTLGKIGHLSVIEKVQLQALRIQLGLLAKHPGIIGTHEDGEVTRLLATVDELLTN